MVYCGPRFPNDGRVTAIGYRVCVCVFARMCIWCGDTTSESEKTETETEAEAEAERQGARRTKLRLGIKRMRMIFSLPLTIK